LDGERLGDEVHGNVVLAHLMGDRADQVECGGMVRIGFQDLPVESLGLGQAARAMVLDSEVQGLLDAWLPGIGSLAG